MAVERIIERLEREKEHMEAECKNPPCVHAQGIGLAISYVKEEASSATREASPPFTRRDSKHFIRGIAVGIVVAMVLVGTVVFIRRGEYLCSTWGRPGELVQCRVHNPSDFP